MFVLLFKQGVQGVAIFGRVRVIDTGPEDRVSLTVSERVFYCTLCFFKNQ